MLFKQFINFKVGALIIHPILIERQFKTTKAHGKLTKMLNLPQRIKCLKRRSILKLLDYVQEPLNEFLVVKVSDWGCTFI